MKHPKIEITRFLWFSACLLLANTYQTNMRTALPAGEIFLQGGRKLDLQDRSLSSKDVNSLAKLISTSTCVANLSLYNVRLSADVRILAVV